MNRRKKLIEVSIPLEAINKASAREKSIRHGHPSTLHLWWARRPLAACRAVLFAQLVDDPSSWPDRFPTEEDQKRERERLHKVIEAMVPWEASTNEHILNNARWEIARSVAWGLGEEPPAKSDAAALLAYLQEKAPPVYDPFCGGGSIPLEAQRLGLRAYGSDLNPVAVLISKALVEIPPKFAGLPPINPDRDPHRAWKGVEGLAEDVRYYGKWMRDEAEKRIGHLYPKAKLPDGSEATVIAWLWARTVASPDPMAKGAHVPLVSSFMLSTKKSSQAWVEVVRDPAAQNGWRFEVRTGKLTADEEKRLKEGTIGRSGGGTCVLTNAPMPFTYIREKGKKDGLGVRLMAVVAEGVRGRVYLTPTAQHGQAARLPKPDVPELDAELPNNPRDFKTPNYGLTKWRDLFTARQLVALTSFSDLVGEARGRALADARASSFLPDDERNLADGGTGAVAYADAVTTYLAMSVDKASTRNCSLALWEAGMGRLAGAMGRQALPMQWSFAETNPLAGAGGDIYGTVVSACEVLDELVPSSFGSVSNIDAPKNHYPIWPAAIATDPPYYDNIGYADLSDFFYVWLRRSLKTTWPDLFRRVLTAKEQELVATPYRHGGASAAEEFFMEGMSAALSAMHDASGEQTPVTIFYAFKQSEVAKEGLTSAGWATFLQAVVRAGFLIDGTWPMRTEATNALKANINALASSIVLVCTKRPPTAAVTTRREFIARLKREMPDALQKIKEAGVGPVDMAQSALGPGMGIFTSYAKVLEPDDSEMTVRTAIALINEVREEILGEEDAHYDPATRFCIDWFQAFGMEGGKSGDAIGMANAYNLGLGDLEQAGVFFAKGGVARLLKRAELREDWRPSNDRRLTHWECTQHLIRVLEAEDGGTAVAAALVAEMSPEDAEAARALAYRLYDICEKKGWAQEAQVYNLLAEEFPHLEQAALDHQGARGPAQGAFDLGEVRS
jgi:putative DNA methylase